MKKFVKSIEKRMLQQKNSILTRCCKIIKNNFAQHLLEYALVIALVAAAAIAMRTYVQRAAQGSIKLVENEAFKDPLEGIDSYHGGSSGLTGPTVPVGSGTITRSKTCTGTSSANCNPRSCTTGQHTTCSTTPVETCTYLSGIMEHRGNCIPGGSATCTADLIVSGCTP